MSQSKNSELDALKSLKRFLHKFAQEVEKSRIAWCHKNNKDTDDNKGRVEFYKELGKEIGASYITVKNNIEAWSQTEFLDVEDGNPRAGINKVNMENLFAIEGFLIKKGLSNRQLAEFLPSKDYNDPQVKAALSTVPHAYRTEVRESVQKYLDLTTENIFGQMRKALIYFRSELDRIASNDKEFSQEKVTQLNDLISRICIWYVSIYQNDRAILLIRTDYWNGHYRRLRFNRSWASEKFASKGAKNLQNQPIKWFVGAEDLVGWPDLLSQPNRVIHQEQLKKGRDWAKDYNFSDDQPSLAYEAIKERKPKQASKFSGKRYLSAEVDERDHSMINSSEKKVYAKDESGYAVPLFSSDRRSVIGTVMVVSSDVEAFTTDDYLNHMGGSTIKEYAAIDEVAHLIERCLHQILKFDSYTYNLLILLDKEKSYQEIMHDVWMTNLMLNRDLNGASTNDKQWLREEADMLEFADKAYSENIIAYNLTSTPETRFESVFNLAFEEFRQDFNIRMAGAVKLCLKRLQEQTPNADRGIILSDMFEVRKTVELDMSHLLNQKGLPGRIFSDYFSPLYKQAHAIQKFINRLEGLLFGVDPQALLPIEELDVQSLVDSIFYMKDCPTAKEIYRDYLLHVTQLFEKTKNDGVLKRLIYRMHVYFHVTIAMLTTMELLPYAELFMILATSTSGMSLGNSSDDVVASLKEHNAILAELDRIYNHQQSQLGRACGSHVDSMICRLKRLDAQALNRRLPIRIDRTTNQRP